jgi:hypothetical protein
MGSHRPQGRYALQIRRGQLALLLDQPEGDEIRIALQGEFWSMLEMAKNGPNDGCDNDARIGILWKMSSELYSWGFSFEPRFTDGPRIYL